MDYLVSAQENVIESKRRKSVKEFFGEEWVIYVDVEVIVCFLENDKKIWRMESNFGLI